MELTQKPHALRCERDQMCELSLHSSFGYSPLARLEIELAPLGGAQLAGSHECQQQQLESSDGFNSAWIVLYRVDQLVQR